jgi:hypothetical protein
MALQAISLCQRSRLRPLRRQRNSNMAKAKVRLVEDDDGLFVELNGKRIAMRGVGRYAKQWISLEPGVVVYGDGDLVIEQHGAALH